MPRRLRRGPRRPGRPQLRTQVLAGVLLVMLVALTAFDVAAVSALRRYLLSRTDSGLQSVLRLYQPWPVYRPGRPGPTTVRPPPALRAAPGALRNPGQARS